MTVFADWDAFLFDLDGVLTPTAEVHMRAWRSTFESLLREEGVEAPYSDADYFAYVDGKQRFDGVASLLASRGLSLPWGAPDDAPDARTVCGVGNRKNRVFASLLADGRISPYPGSLRLLDALRGRPLAVVSSSKNAEGVLRAAGIRDRFDVVVDGVVAERELLPSKPDPQVFLRGAELLGAEPARSVVFEDALSGVAAGAAGGFGLVIGVDRVGAASELRRAGAHRVVRDLDELLADAARSSAAPGGE